LQLETTDQLKPIFGESVNEGFHENACFNSYRMFVSVDPDDAVHAQHVDGRSTGGAVTVCRCRTRTPRTDWQRSVCVRFEASAQVAKIFWP
jgi:hypothetical protein